MDLLSWITVWDFQRMACDRFFRFPNLSQQHFARLQEVAMDFASSIASLLTFLQLLLVFRSSIMDSFYCTIIMIKDLFIQHQLENVDGKTCVNDEKEKTLW